MMRRKIPLLGTAFLICYLIWLPTRTVSSPQSLVVVELFTSQGCSSCPPAEAFLRTLASRHDVMALEYHVDYWDDIGWKDPFSDRLFTQRQRAYADQLGHGRIYTPQMVINGTKDAVGSRHQKVEALIQQAHYTNQTATEKTTGLILRANDKNGFSIALKGHSPTPLDILLISFDNQHITHVKRGENAGRKLINAHVVRRLETLGKWQGGDMEIPVDTAQLRGDGQVVFLQNPLTGAIEAARLWRDLSS